MIRNRSKGNNHITRRRLLKGAATGAGVVLGSGLVKGFPTIWAQNIKDVKLVQVGGSYSAIIDIGRQASKDLGFQVEMQTADHDALMNRLVNEPKTIDIADTEFFAQYYMVGRNIVQPIPVKKYKWWDKTVPIFTKGEYPDGRKVSAQGTSPYKVQYLESKDAEDVRQGADGLLSGIPTVYNADTLGIRPDLIKRPIEQLGDLLEPGVQGQGGDRRQCLRSASSMWRWRWRRAAT